MRNVSRIRAPARVPAWHDVVIEGKNSTTKAI
jgi:hypothetical protein